MAHIHATRVFPTGARSLLRSLGAGHTHLQVGEEPAVVLEDGVHAVRHGHRVLPVVVRDASVVLLHRHDEATQLFQLKAVGKRHARGTGRESARYSQVPAPGPHPLDHMGLQGAWCPRASLTASRPVQTGGPAWLCSDLLTAHHREGQLGLSSLPHCRPHPTEPPKCTPPSH